jgi:hypothetical protein
MVVFFGQAVSSLGLPGIPKTLFHVFISYNTREDNL